MQTATLPWIIPLPRVYRPQDDTRLLAAALADAPVPRGARVLDLCTGSGILAVTAARMGASNVVAVNISRSAMASVRVNAGLRWLPISALRGDILCDDDPEAMRLGKFDVVLANPPYVPGVGNAHAGTRHWLGGPDGRSILDPLCDMAFDLLDRDGFMLVVQSEFADVEATLRRLRDTGLKAAAVARMRIPFGRVLRRQAAFLAATDKCPQGCRTEELIVVRADKLVVPQ